ncbi:DNA-binding protein WhiA [Clostridia bacterium OttesenSCG-928-F22]|nr:DNA-binding protein WhiA [Clostridia bacterium OttesenSCG-928-F22]
MSFSSDIKESLIQIQQRENHCSKAECLAMVYVGGSISPYGGIRFLLRTENALVARHGYALLSALYGVQAQILQGEGKRLDKKHSYTLEIEGERAREILLDLGVIHMDGGVLGLCEFNVDKLKRRCCRAAFLRGCYIMCGSLSNPNKMYHLEFVFQDEQLAKSVLTLLQGFGIDKANITERKGAQVLYIKDSTCIADFLTIIGAHDATLELENIRVWKDVKNNVNRAVNCETANLQKTVDASFRQQENIQYIIAHMGLEQLPPKLREIAEVRLNYPDAPLSELGQYLSHPVGKSGINHRLRKIDEIAQDLKISRGDA